MNHTLELVTLYGYAIVFVVVFLDQAIVSLPSPPFVAAMGALSASGRFNPCFAVVVVLGAASLADCLWFVIGRSRKACLPTRFIPNILKRRAAKMATFVGCGMLGGLLTVKFSLVPSSLLPYFAGSTRFPVARFVMFGMIANLVWASVFFFGGFFGAAISVDGWPKL
jgi:membrane protein DedA with SNARE-associated domain